MVEMQRVSAPGTLESIAHAFAASTFAASALRNVFSIMQHLATVVTIQSRRCRADQWFKPLSSSHQDDLGCRLHGQPPGAAGPH